MFRRSERFLIIIDKLFVSFPRIILRNKRIEHENVGYETIFKSLRITCTVDNVVIKYILITQDHKMVFSIDRYETRFGICK